MWGPNFAYLNIDSISGPDDLLCIQNTYLKPGVHCLAPSFLPWVTLTSFAPCCPSLRDLVPALTSASDPVPLKAVTDS